MVGAVKQILSGNYEKYEDPNSEGKIGYQYQDGISYNINFGYFNNFGW